MFFLHNEVPSYEDSTTQLFLAPFSARESFNLAQSSALSIVQLKWGGHLTQWPPPFPLTFVLA